MCDFISWIEKDGKLYYLTDAEIFSPKGKKKLAGCSGNDFIGHGAIRRYFGLNGGHDKEVRSFWDVSRLPTELAAKIKDFDVYWAETFKTYLYCNDYCRIIRNAPAKWARQALNALKKSRRRFTKSDIGYYLKGIIRDRLNSAFKLEIWEYFAKARPAKFRLHYLICYASPSYQEKAWKLLRGKGITQQDVNALSEYEPYCRRAKRLLRKRCQQ